MVKFTVHRSRFIKCIPHAIHCLAFEDTAESSRLALTRADGSIELWNVKNNWNQERRIPGCDGLSVEALVWHGSRLFTAGLHGEITEWDIDRLVPKFSVDSYGGAVWSLAVNNSRSHLAVGCEDGVVRLFEILEDGLCYYKSLTKQDGRILSLTWHKNDQVLVTGGSDSTIRVYNSLTGHCDLRITVDEFQQRSTLIWSLHITSNMTIISGDSLGNTQFWDAQTGTLIQSFRAHQADTLALCVSKSEDMVFSSGVDNKLVQFKLVTAGTDASWAIAGQRRVHSHDVRSLALDGSGKMLVSGGVDTVLVSYDVAHFLTHMPRKIFAYGQRPFIHMAPKANILMYQTNSALQFWELGKTVSPNNTELVQNPSHLLQINKKASEHICCSTLSSCAKWAAFSDINKVSLFKIDLGGGNHDREDAKIKVKKVLPLPEDLNPAQLQAFTPDSSKLICASSSKHLQILDLSSEAPFSLSSVATTENDFSPFVALALSADSCYAATADTNSNISVINLSEKRIHCALPWCEYQVTAMAFQPETNNLALVCANHQILIYDIETACHTKWSRRAAKAGLPKQWMKVSKKAVKIDFLPSNPQQMIIQDHTMFTLLDLSEPLPDPKCQLFENWRKEYNPKRKRNASGEEKREVSSKSAQTAFKFCKKYQFLLFDGFLEDGSLIVAEQPHMTVLESLPPTLQRKRYGT